MVLIENPILNFLFFDETLHNFYTVLKIQLDLFSGEPDILGIVGVPCQVILCFFVKMIYELISVGSNIIPIDVEVRPLVAEGLQSKIADSTIFLCIFLNLASSQLHKLVHL